MNERPTWAKLFLSIAFKMSARSTCPRRRTGAVIASSDHQILTTGYNGAPRGLDHCTDVGCLMIEGHCLRSVHAEMNAVLQAARLGVSLAGAILYATDRPCIRCIPALLQVDIGQIVYSRPYDTDEQLEEVERMCFKLGVGISCVNQSDY